MLDDRERQIANAAALLSTDEFNADGKPRLDAINAVLTKDGLEPMTKDERDLTWDTIAAKADAELAAPDGPELDAVADEGPWAWVRVIESQTNPVAVYLNGRFLASLRVAGDAALLPPAAIASLRNSDITFTETPQ